MYEARRSDGAPGAPLILTFHGTGGTPDQFHGLAQRLLPAAHVVSPRGDVSENGALRYFRRTGEGVYDMADLARAQDKMAGFIAAEKTRTGAARVLALGYSNGANIAAAVALLRPDLFDDLMLLHPMIPFTPDPAPGLKGRRFLIASGERDPLCPVPQTRALIVWLRRQGAEITEVWHPGGHEIAARELEALARFLA